MEVIAEKTNQNQNQNVTSWAPFVHQNAKQERVLHHVHERLSISSRLDW